MIDITLEEKKKLYDLGVQHAREDMKQEMLLLLKVALSCSSNPEVTTEIEKLIYILGAW